MKPLRINGRAVDVGDVVEIEGVYREIRAIDRYNMRVTFRDGGTVVYRDMVERDGVLRIGEREVA